MIKIEIDHWAKKFQPTSSMNWWNFQSGDELEKIWEKDKSQQDFWYHLVGYEDFE